MPSRPVREVAAWAGTAVLCTVAVWHAGWMALDELARRSYRRKPPQ